MGGRAHVAVIGGGVTGCGLARDLSMRGFEVTVFERGSLAAGATGNMHCLLHSGARYAVSDAETARACRRENEIIRRIAPHCVEACGGLFVKRPEDEAAYFQTKIDLCRACNIPVEELSADEVRRLEPKIATDIDRAISVPDARVDPFRLTVANAVSALQEGASIHTHAEVTDLLIEDGTVEAVEVVHSETGREKEIFEIDHVVNAAGAWAGEVGALADIVIPMCPTKGAMAILGGDHVDTVINRCRPKTEGDIIVPYGEFDIVGTTTEAIDDPDRFSRQQREVELLIESLGTLVPELSRSQLEQSYWGVRPLYDPPAHEQRGEDSLKRTHFLLDHRERDGIGGFTSIVGGKLTTYRAMAEDAADLLCSRFGVEASCATEDRRLPGRSADQDLESYSAEFGVPARLVPSW